MNFPKQPERIAPGLPYLLNYQRRNLIHKIEAGVSITALFRAGVACPNVTQPGKESG